MLQTNKICEVRAKVNPSEKVALELLAQRERRNLSETIRELIREAAAREGLWPPETKKKLEVQT